jgi:hypothetical protein
LGEEDQDQGVSFDDVVKANPMSSSPIFQTVADPVISNNDCDPAVRPQQSPAWGGISEPGIPVSEEQDLTVDEIQATRLQGSAQSKGEEQSSISTQQQYHLTSELGSYQEEASFAEDIDKYTLSALNTRRLDLPQQLSTPSEPVSVPNHGDSSASRHWPQPIQTSELRLNAVLVPEHGESVESQPSESGLSGTSPSTPTMRTATELPASPVIDHPNNAADVAQTDVPVTSSSSKPLSEMEDDPPGSGLTPQTPRKPLLRPASMIDLSSPDPLPSGSASNEVLSLPASSETGYVTLNRRATPPRRHMLPAAAYSVVVHHKVTELQATSAQMQFPQTPQHQRIRQSVQQVPGSPGLGDLALLMQNAALLEERLAEGEIPSDKRKSIRQIPIVKEPVQIPDPSPEHLEPQQQAPRKRMPSFRNPLSRRKSSSKERHQPVAAIQPPPRESSLPAIYSAGLPPEEPEHLLTPEPTSNVEDDIPPTPPPKSSPSKYLNGLRRFATTSKSSGISHGASPRRSISVSEISSEDSASVITPSDSSSYQYTDKEGLGYDSKVPWPSKHSTPKKDSAALSRAASLAEKVFSRNRTKSGASMLSVRKSSGELQTFYT